MMKKIPTLFIVIPCYNEEEVLPITAPEFLKKLNELVKANRIHQDSKILFVDDGSKDSTWEKIMEFSFDYSQIIGIRQSRNRGHQNAVYAGLMESKDRADITISIDCDGQDDINAMDKMIAEYEKGSEIVYGVRSDRETDTFFKRTTAQSFYKIMELMGVESIYNHADYRLVSSRVLKEFANFKEVNLFLRGMFPLVGFKSTSVYYKRFERIAGESKYPISKMLNLAFEGITSLSVKPIRLVTSLGIFVSAISFLIIIWIFIAYFTNKTVSGWASNATLISFFCGVQLICTGIIGEYVGKIYLEVKGRPKYIISDRTED
ncbi:putative glycosyltransferase [Streptococcus mutans LJ23]|uniref:Putative glycosyltransferase n=2 Tax=Streptococcus mutans TaxID=1309 RepID=A2V8B6_STRMG|nr:glycosyltransferase family 2 protein [Streptococcus mutans]MCB5015802.1 glycosyltransferase family 2 protein [Streptococcus mutans]MCB5153285.1 glycosyltransferase family 2 protein [Streptococcus mutans]MDT9490290.1 glycosyltransferase family 2 protein [Streptococcus mutans]MDT9564248.1 glycosyltransferase family 2 protein [Streptococcus mutans]MDT9577499.1 glycosyltransferase family 2 protein [Streptococcus mutans]